MNVKCLDENGLSVDMSEKEIETYIDYVKNKNPNEEIEYLIIKIDGEYVDLEYKTKPLPFQHIRRITGYLVGDTTTWNDAKKAELKDRMKHGHY